VIDMTAILQWLKNTDLLFADLRSHWFDPAQSADRLHHGWDKHIRPPDLF